MQGFYPGGIAIFSPLTREGELTHSICFALFSAIISCEALPGGEPAAFEITNFVDVVQKDKTLGHKCGTWKSIQIIAWFPVNTIGYLSAVMPTSECLNLFFY